MANEQSETGLAIGRGRGKRQFRVRQRLIRDHYIPLIAARSVGAVKLDLALRCIALSPQHLGQRDQPGIVVRTWSYEALHDIVKEEPVPRIGGNSSEQAVRALKGKWVKDQLKKLEARGLVRLTARPGSRPDIVMLRDDGSADPYDDPGTAWNEAKDKTARDVYFTISGGLIGSGELRAWGAPEIAAYFAALSAEGQDRNRSAPDGTGTWYRPLEWFRNGQLAPANRVLLPFSKSQLEKGFASLEAKQLIVVTRGVTQTPGDPKSRFNQRRNIYRNRLGFE